MSYRVHLIATISPPPHRAGAGLAVQRQDMRVALSDVAAAIDGLVIAAVEAGAFDNGGCVSVVIQREALGMVPG